MNQVVNEECTVCWRVYSHELVPVALNCGHSFCQECSRVINRCPLCRKRVQAGAEKPTNYSLLSLVSRINEVGTKVTKDEETQTEKPQRLKKAIIPQGLEVITPGIALSVIVKMTRIQQQLVKLFTVNSNRRPN